MLAENIAMDELQMITDRLREEIELADFVTNGQRVPVTASFGVCLAEAPLDPSEETLDEIIALADQAMYSSKTSGRNCVTYVSFRGPVAEAAASRRSPVQWAASR